MKINIIGKGNVASHLKNAFSASHDVKLVNSRSLDELDYDADFYILSVSDDAISQVAQALGNELKKCPFCAENYIVAHTSGCTPIDVLSSNFKHCGVLYPLQTFTAGHTLDYAAVPVFIEGSDVTTVQSLGELSLNVFRNVRILDSNQRKILHLSATFASNFSNHIFNLADKKLQEIGLDFSIMIPLISATLDKLKRMSPVEAQTGPAVRNDHNTISSHRALLSNDPDMLKIYDLLTESIMKN